MIKVQTPLARLAFPDLFVPKAIEEDKDPTYGCNLLFALDADMTDLKAAVRQAGEEKWGKERFDELVRTKQLRLPFKDQAEKADKWVGYTEGFYIITRTKEQPGLINRQGQPILDPTAVYGGLQVYASVNAYAWEHRTGGNGVSFGLLNLMVWKDDGTKWGGRAEPTKDFKDLIERAKAEDPTAGAKPASKDALFGDL